jgi:hypothetical protein
MASQQVVCRNGTFDLVSKTFVEAPPTSSSLPVAYVDYEPSSPEIKEVQKLFEQYVGNDAERNRLLHFLKGCIVDERVSGGRMYTIYGSGDNGKSTFEAILRRLLGNKCMPLPLLKSEDAPYTQLLPDFVQHFINSSVKLVVIPDIPSQQHYVDEPIQGMQTLLDSGIDILQVGWNPMSNHPLHAYMEPDIQFDAVFANCAVEGLKRTFPIDWRFSNSTSYMDGLVQPLLWLLCNM